MAVTIRPVGPEDCGDILRLIRQQAAFEGESDSVTLTEDIIRRDAFGERPRFLALLAEVEGAIMGIVVLHEAYSSWRGAPTLVIHDLFVIDERRGGGVGTALLSEAVRLAGERGCCRVDVNVLDWNGAARRFYERQGFRRLDRWLPHRLEMER